MDALNLFRIQYSPKRNRRILSLEEAMASMENNDESRAPVDSPGKRSEPITNLLKRYNVGLTAAKANRILLAEGILEEKTRPSETEPGKLRTYKALTDTGLRYGINRVQQQVAETSPRYFDDSFRELVSKYLVQD
jgi:hypothetical protein